MYYNMFLNKNMLLKYFVIRLILVRIGVILKFGFGKVLEGIANFGEDIEAKF